ncbi:protein of unassigned function [Methylobacterium oryzae CBMB20]|uniref:Protein of unassigned function n=1 Tax=Methylobacterium oryzae CBMB20 TaxID=693986 RepID=A0A089P4X2_9HYPH|nr:protein of unassigned function [Methylobacterium oryzae CBMB20]
MIGAGLGVVCHVPDPVRVRGLERRPRIDERRLGPGLRCGLYAILRMAVLLHAVHHRRGIL